MDFVSLVEVSSTASDIVMEGVVNTLKARDIDIKKVRFSCIDGTNSMSGVHNGLQRRLRNHAPHATYINGCWHRLAFCFKHLFEEFPWLQSIDSLLLGLWKTFHFSCKNRFILREIQKAYGMKSLNVIKAAVTRWLSHSAACKHCGERYGMIFGSLDDIITRKPRPELIGYRDEMLNADCFTNNFLKRCSCRYEYIVTCATVRPQRFRSCKTRFIENSNYLEWHAKHQQCPLKELSCLSRCPFSDRIVRKTKYSGETYKKKVKSRSLNFYQRVSWKYWQIFLG